MAFVNGCTTGQTQNNGGLQSKFRKQGIENIRKMKSHLGIRANTGLAGDVDHAAQLQRCLSEVRLVAA